MFQRNHGVDPSLLQEFSCLKQNISCDRVQSVEPVKDIEQHTICRRHNYMQGVIVTLVDMCNFSQHAYS